VSGILWATPRDFPNQVQQLGPDEYFVMGDNSLVSYDARCWDDPIKLPGEDLVLDAGRVPGRFLLGKAFFVYWPAGYRPLSSWPPVVPNFADMRFIH
jgi:signal peptidase I